MLTMNKTWFITGASRGFGRIWAEAALQRGDKVTYATDFGKSAKRADGMEAYGPLRQRMFGRLANLERGNPQATADAVLKLVDTEEPPLRMMFGTQNLPEARAAYAERLATWEAWEAVSNAAQGEPLTSGPGAALTTAQ
jgi:NAD(P)-dependent dehydrogenase (short-subunit alcohol dehydrogenase family)